MNQPQRRTDTRRLVSRPATRASNDNRPSYRPAPYTGDGMECVRNVDPATPRQRLLDVAAWHDRRSGKRSVMIAWALREAAGR